MDPDLGRLLLEASRQVGADLVAELQERGFDDARPGHAAVALRIDRRSGTRMGDLAARAGMTKQGMLLLVDDLENRGYVRRVADPDDARARIVRLTVRGRRYVAEFRRALAAVEGRARRDLELVEPRRYAASAHDAHGVELWWQIRGAQNFAVEAAMIESGLPPTHYSFANALRIAMENPDAEERWLKGEHVFANVMPDSFEADNSPQVRAARVAALIAAAMAQEVPDSGIEPAGKALNSL